MSKTLQLTQELIARPSVTPDDHGCQELLSERLRKIDFTIENIPCAGVSNLWARRGTNGPLLVFAGHTDVVATGPLEQWRFPPFNPTIADEHLYGRGAADMKASVAAMITATEAFIEENPTHNGSIAFLITSGEEGPGFDGTPKVLEKLDARNEIIDYCIIGEPTSDQQFGDTIKIGRRGSLGGDLLIKGKQGHIAYPHLAANPIHLGAAAIAELCRQEWDQGTEDFQPTSMQISNITSGTGATNVIPGELQMQFNFRFSPANTAEQLQQKVESILNNHQLNYQIQWHLSGPSYYRQAESLAEACQQIIADTTGITAQFSTSGGTSDGRFMGDNVKQIIEFGPINASIHQINERVGIAELEQLQAVYQGILQRLLH